MQESQKVESMFKMRQEFKECRTNQDGKAASQPPQCQSEKVGIRELIEKIKN